MPTVDVHSLGRVDATIGVDRLKCGGCSEQQGYVCSHSWHAAWCWYKVTPRLEAAGHKVVVPDMPSHGRDWRPPGSVTMRDYVDTVARILDDEEQPVVLVVHSRGGLQVTQVAEERPAKIRQLVYVAALLPPIGDVVSLAQSRAGRGEWGTDPDSWLRANVDVNRNDGWDMIRREACREALYADCADEDVALAYALLTPEPRGPQSPTESPIRTTPQNFGRIRRAYIELTHDRAGHLAGSEAHVLGDTVRAGPDDRSQSFGVLLQTR
jgi:pimeloyl-ACP methyl ester carboxylesterase